MRGGAPLVSQRFAIVAPTLSTYTERPRLENIWREPGNARPVLTRALDAAAWSPDGALGEACAALILCAAGRAEQVRLLPFAGVPAAEREEATAQWRAGDESAWSTAGLTSLAQRASATRTAIEAATRGIPDEDSRLDTLGRAAIMARRALGELRARLVITMPSLAESLECSRPAAGDAIERLVAAGIARELTGRGRDRVYAWGAACDVAKAAAAS